MLSFTQKFLKHIAVFLLLLLNFNANSQKISINYPKNFESIQRDSRSNIIVICENFTDVELHNIWIEKGGSKNKKYSKNLILGRAKTFRKSKKYSEITIPFSVDKNTIIGNYKVFIQVIDTMKDTITTNSNFYVDKK